jgi:phenylacetyl-CoA:acceptor oxidoreductase subunit 2
MTWRAWPTALAALVFIYCQVRIVMGAQGIPAWRETATGVLLFVTALAEGAGLFCAVMAWVGLPVQAPIALGVLLVVRAVAFRFWQRRMEAGPATVAAQWAQHCAPRIRIAGAIVPLLALLLAIFAGSLAPVLVTVAGLLAAGTGAAFKFLLITRMGQYQGYSLPHMPVRGVPRVAPR